MKISEVALHRVSLPLVSPFRTSFGTQTRKDALLVEVQTPDAHGWGECVALSDPSYSSEYVDGAEHLLRTFALPRLLAAGDVSAARVAPLLAGIKGHPMAKAAVELAVLDAELRASNRSLGDHLGAVHDRVPAGVSVGIMDSIPELLDAVAGYVDGGYRRIKLKIEPGWDIDPVAAVRERFGDILLQVDANTAYTLGDASHLARLDLRGHAALARLITTIRTAITAALIPNTVRPPRARIRSLCCMRAPSSLVPTDNRGDRRWRVPRSRASVPGRPGPLPGVISPAPGRGTAPPDADVCAAGRLSSDEHSS
jgi:O-succinylbenzoate synthase